MKPEPQPFSDTHILAIDDDPGVLQLITDYLGDNEIRVTTMPNGSEVSNFLERTLIDLIIVDIKLPGEDGLQITRRVRGTSNVPIIMLTGRTDEADRVMGLELGADDYLTKPFSPRELLARVRALLRRARALDPVGTGLARARAFRFSGWELNVRIRRLTSPLGKDIELTKTEFNLLVAFLMAPQRVLSREQLIEMSRLHNDEIYDRAIDVQVGRLRKKLDPSSTEKMIKTERGSGYVFVPTPEMIR
jgi:DNA-binding response OmpR family regulator